MVKYLQISRTKKFIFFILIIVIFSTYFIVLKKRNNIIDERYSSQSSDLTYQEQVQLTREANDGNARSASKLVDFHIDHTMNYEEALMWMKEAIKNGATWYSEKDLDELIRNIDLKEN